MVTSRRSSRGTRGGSSTRRVAALVAAGRQALRRGRAAAGGAGRARAKPRAWRAAVGAAAEPGGLLGHGVAERPCAVCAALRRAAGDAGRAGSADGAAGTADGSLLASAAA